MIISFIILTINTVLLLILLVFFSTYFGAKLKRKNMTSVNPIFSSNVTQNIGNVEEIRNMNFLSSQVSHIFNVFCEENGEIVQITEIAKELLESKKETDRETETALLTSKYGSLIDEGRRKVFALSLGKLSKIPIECLLESLNGILIKSREGNFSKLKEAPGYDAKNGFRVPHHWEEFKIAALNQIYKEQFLAWMLEYDELSFSSILLMLPILESLNNPSIKLDDQIWDKLLLTGKGQEQLKKFQSKYNFLIKNKPLQSFSIELRKITTTRNIHTTIHDYYKCFEKTFKWLVDLLIEGTQPLKNRAVSKKDQMIYIRALGDGQRIEDKLKNILKGNLSKKILAYKLRKMLPSLRKYFEWSIKSTQAKIEELEARQNAIDDILMICKEKREQISGQCAQPTVAARKRKDLHKVEFNIQIIIKDLLKKYEKLMERGSSKSEAATQFNRELHSILKEKITNLKHIQDTEAYFILGKNKITAQQKLLTTEPYSLKEMFPLISSLLSYIDIGVAEKQDRWKKKRLNLCVRQFDEMIEKELLSESEVTHVKSVKNQYPSTDFSDESEEEESTSDGLSKEIPDLSHVLKGEKMQSCLDGKIKNNQLNGYLSQIIEGLLKQIQIHLHGKQGKEIYDHLLLGAAALEQMAQAIYEGRTSHVVLGFRSSLIHCHFAVEQILSQKSEGTVNSHNLSFLAKGLERKHMKFSRKEQEFLEEIRVHLWFHYPEDYRLYFEGRKCPKALSLLNALFRSEAENIQEAMVFSFDKYCQTLEFVIGLTGALQPNIVEILREKTDELKEFSKLGSEEPKKNPAVNSPLISRIDDVIKVLYPLNQLTHIKDLDDGWLLANFNTIEKYLRIMRISLELPQEATKHSLQKFIRIETLLNAEKLFKNLFRVISFLQSGRDTRMHDLNKFYSIIKEFYEAPLSEADRNLLGSINLSITHHYFHRKSHANLKKNYERFLRESCALSSVDEGFSVTMDEKQIVSQETLQMEEEKITEIIECSLNLFIKLLHPVVNEMKKINNDIEEGIKSLNRLKIG